MPSAREEARQAAKTEPIKFYGTGESNAQLYKMAGADAASDVWAPLLKEAHDWIYERCVADVPPGSTWWTERKALLVKLREALDA